MTAEQDAAPDEQRVGPPVRDSGVLLHPTSLPGPHGIGDLGDAAYRWLDFLADGRQQVWQILPLGPPGFGASPYAARSAFAGNPLLISLDRLAADGLLPESDLAVTPQSETDRVNYEEVADFKLPTLRRAYRRFCSGGGAERPDYQAFVADNTYWLDDYALFAALRDTHGDAAWNTWETPLVRREARALAEAATENAEDIDFHRFVQFAFWQQWSALKVAASARGIRIMGDIPIFVAHDSADVWTHQEIFLLDRDGNPTVVAGVPPDFFSASGQRWGNPLYDWGRMAETGYRWWIERFRFVLRSVDVVRIDHFRGFEAYWEVPATEETAANGRWVQGPGQAFFDAVSADLGPLPVVVEDLGLITRSVDDLREALRFPGMKVLQFAFGDDAANPYLPHNYDWNCVVYSGTHDNDTTEGWFASLPEGQRTHIVRYVGDGVEPISRAIMRLALGSVARTAIVPLQDVLGLGSDARMNVPGWGTGNWGWRATSEQIDVKHAAWLRSMTELYGRAAQVGTE
jgi:4-alpha-glucanotransferase